jgi:hypothetical protein
MKYDYTQITNILQRTLEWLGEDRFSQMRVTELEKIIRDRETAIPLPGRSQFRAAIHEFRARRWPQSAPRRRS